MVYHMFLSVLRGAEGQNFLGVFRKKGKGITEKSPSKKHYLPSSTDPYSNPIPKSYEVVCVYTCLGF